MCFCLRLLMSAYIFIHKYALMGIPHTHLPTQPQWYWKFDQIFMNHNRLMTVNVRTYTEWKIPARAWVHLIFSAFSLFVHSFTCYSIYSQSKMRDCCFLCYLVLLSPFYSHLLQCFFASASFYRSIVLMPIHFEYLTRIYVYQTVIIKFGMQFQSAK